MKTFQSFQTRINRRSSMGSKWRQLSSVFSNSFLFFSPDCIVVCAISILPQIISSLKSFAKFLETVPKNPTMISITDTLYHSYFYAIWPGLGIYLVFSFKNNQNVSETAKKISSVCGHSPMVRETEVRSQVESYQRLKNGTWCLLA